MLLSVIIPCYNAGKYIKRTLDSIVCQDMSDVEIILVNDGSQDNTLSVINSFAVEYQNIIVISQDNNGVSVARNRGMMEAKGRYICFIDADDIVVPTYLADIKNVLSDEYDLICFGFKYYKSENKIIDCFPKHRAKTILYDFLTNRVLHSIFSGIYRKEFLAKYDIKFDENTYYGEDTEFLIKVFVHVDEKRVFLLNKILYLYLYNPTSALHQTKEYNQKKFTTFLSSLRSMDYLRKMSSDKSIYNAIYNRTLYKMIVGFHLSHGADFFIPYIKMLKHYPPFSYSLFYLYNILYVTRYKLFRF